jgi:pimeloyl-ACP methyl ester carboxylesterase
MLITIQKRILDVRMLDWSVDDHIQFDVPAALQFVKNKTLHKRVHWIGHSMGGMIMFAYLQQVPPDEESGVKSFTAMGVPMVVFHPLSEPLEFMLNIKTALKVGSRVVGSSAPATWKVIFGNLGTPMDRLFYNNDNIDGDVLRALSRRAEEEISPSQLKQMINLVSTERFSSLDGTIDYTARLSEITTPTYFIVGTVDNLATVGAVRYTYRQVGSEPKKFGLFGRVNSHEHDYGHNDVAIGRHVRREVFPEILDWLKIFPCQPSEDELLMQPMEKGVTGEK